MPVQLSDLDMRSKPSFRSSLLSDLFTKETKEILPQLKGIELRQLNSLLYFFLYESFYSQEQEVSTQTSYVQVDYKNLHILNTIKFGFEKKQEPKELEQEALLSVVSNFSEVEKVKSIYLQRYREEIQIYVLLFISQYDSDLMDTLLDIEYNIRKKYPQLVFEFFYPPARISEKKDFIHPQAQCIYAR